MIGRVTLAAAFLLGTRAATQPPQVVTLGHDIHAVMGATAGTAGGAAVVVPQRNTFMVVTPAGNAILRALDTRSTKSNERGWLQATIADADARLIR